MSQFNGQNFIALTQGDTVRVIMHRGPGTSIVFSVEELEFIVDVYGWDHLPQTRLFYEGAATRSHTMREITKRKVMSEFQVEVSTLRHDEDPVKVVLKFSIRKLNQFREFTADLIENPKWMPDNILDTTDSESSDSESDSEGPKPSGECDDRSKQCPCYHW